ncbi:hypothetical protein Dda_8806 [Drechslerella dactyloides]|uniref:Uncharacterized protein n=1 Tax=Drechslerella dactyloides TaxID=74499 RepID=A0AAD6IQ01_DREDA|nr:hypothetical protein Dda_8806 [Drechslerella dactyloides]
MQIISIFLTILGLASTLQANPTPINNADDAVAPPAPGPIFQISGFRNSGSIKLGASQGQALVYFHVKDTGNGIEAECNFKTQTGAPAIGLAPFFTTCDIVGMDFAIQRFERDYYLTISHQWNRGAIINSGTIWLGNKLNYQVKNGWKSWTLAAPWSFEIPYKSVKPNPAA